MGNSATKKYTVQTLENKVTCPDLLWWGLAQGDFILSLIFWTPSIDFNIKLII